VHNTVNAHPTHGLPLQDHSASLSEDEENCTENVNSVGARIEPGVTADVT